MRALRAHTYQHPGYLAVCRRLPTAPDWTRGLVYGVRCIHNVRLIELREKRKPRLSFALPG